MSENTLNSALARMGYKNEATAHGVRALFSTVANEAGWPPDVIERQLTHAERNQVRAAYNRSTYLAERSKLLQWWADRLDDTPAPSRPRPRRSADPGFVSQPLARQLGQADELRHLRQPCSRQQHVRTAALLLSGAGCASWCPAFWRICS